MQTDLIYDVGLHHGDDTAYYLTKGFRVLAIEANPVLARNCEKRFSSDIREGRLRILNVGIGPSEGHFTFWVHRVHDEWSSFIRNPSWKGEDCEAISVRCVPFERILVEHGTPFYLKVDIEGADKLVIQALDREHTPRYISFEGGSDTVRNLCRLTELGYNEFKCIDQTTHNFPQKALSVNNEDRWNRARRRFAAWKWETTRRLGLDDSWLASVWRTVRILGSRQPTVEPTDARTSAGWIFPTGSSGPFGEDTPGGWQSLDELLYNWLHRRFRRFDRGTLRAEPWYDIHARLDTVQAESDCQSSFGFQTSATTPDSRSD